MPELAYIKAVAIGELIAPVLPLSYFLPEDEANAKVRKILRYYMQRETPLTRGRTREYFIQVHNNVEEEDRSPDWVAVPDSITDTQFIATFGRDYAEYLVTEASGDHTMKPIDLFTTVYVAVAKRGNVTSEFIGKITTGLSDDLQYDANLDEDVISLVYRFYGGHVNADNARTNLTGWLADIPEVALRVRLTLEQATNSGLTSLVTIGRAIMKYPDFDWAKLNVLTGGELTNFMTAVTAVGGNQYYGFNKTLGAARSTLYSSIGYVAKELLIALNGEMSLKRYAGWVRAPKNAAVVRSLIDTYKTQYITRMETAEATDGERVAVTQLRALLGNAENASLFS